jgi:plastocyanin
MNRITQSFCLNRLATHASFLLSSALLLTSGRASIVDVSVGDDFFSPANATINAGDAVHWSWTGINSHSSTSTSSPALWDSGIHGNGFSFSFTFPNAGSFPYECVVHAAFGMVGSVTVQAVNLPPTVSMTAPTNGATFAAPWTGTLSARSSDPDGTVTRLKFLSGAIVLGTVTNPPATASIRVTNLAAATYTFTAQATDNGGASTTSAGVTVHVVTPAVITLSEPQRPTSSSFQFTYTATPGLHYIVRRSSDLSTFVSLRTNLAAASPVTFVDTNATGTMNYYRVELQPNP